MSTGAGPFTYYSSLSGSSGRSGGAARSGGPTKAQLAQAEKEQEFLRLRDLLAAIVDVHRVEFETVGRPVPAKPPAPDLSTFLRTREEQELEGLSVFKRAERKKAKERANLLAAEDLKKEQRRLEDEHQASQAEADAWWKRLNENDPETVIAAVDQAFEDNEAPSAPVDVEGETLSLVVLALSPDVIPERIPDVTPSGKATTKKMTKSIRADTYLTLISGHLLVSVKEALAVAPAIQTVKAVVVRETDPDVFGERRYEALIAASYIRTDLSRVRWSQATSPEIVEQAANDLLWELKDRPPELKPLDLDEEPDLKVFVDAINEKVKSG